ncbi:MAG: histidinol-phosphate transaminase [Clostridia bacterium]|nr:histidinol-phosphate transaminase [Clostridia bacterium]
MSDYLLPRLQALAPYTPGEQPQDKRYLKLNTNESPFPPSPMVLDALSREQVSALNLYPDPSCAALKRAIADEYGLAPENVFVGNGSDEVLGFSFMAYADAAHPMVIPSVSYGFYQVYAALLGAPARKIPLREDFTVPVEPFLSCGGMVAIANPNAPTGIAMALPDVERIVSSNPKNIVLIDEAYVDFGGESALPLLSKYHNLLIVRTFSKSRSLAGGRLGYALANQAIISDLERVKFSFHPYSINRLTILAGVAALSDKPYFERCVREICRVRVETSNQLLELGFRVTPSSTNFLFASPPSRDGRGYYEALRQRGILVRYFAQETLTEYVRITVGTQEQMERLLFATKELIEEGKA